MAALTLVRLSHGELVASAEPLASAFKKIQELLPEEVKVSPESLDDYLSLDLGPLNTPDAGVFRDVLTALRRRRRALVSSLIAIDPRWRVFPNRV